jgi:6-hydroxycyclohex-1-ene-1-carbonyl-CoA dehydrogenase
MKIVRRGFRMVGSGRMDEFEETLGPPPPGWSSIEVLACGVCHTDVGYLYDGVPTMHGLPIVLGHEIVGRVVGTDRTVLVPSVSPCGECGACRRDRPTACKASLMPGNHHDGGFATHAHVPSRWLVDVPPLPDGLEAWQLAAVADAVSTAYQAMVRARCRPGTAAIVVGAGGVGGFLIEMLIDLGLAVVAIDVAPSSRERAQAHGAAAIDPTGKDPRGVRAEAIRLLQPRGVDAEMWHIFECSGSAAGQTLAFQLLTRGATLSLVGYTAEAISVRLSNVMALDAELYGNWGCSPRHFPEVLARCVAGRIDLASAVERHPLSAAASVLAAVHRHELSRRAVLVPDSLIARSSS